MAEQCVLLGAVHPEVGMLYLEVIPDSEVGYADIYQITDTIGTGDYLVIMKPAWREHEPTFDGKQWDEWVIHTHLIRTHWYTNDEIQRICQKHSLSCAELQRWGENVSIWKDIPVMIGREEGYVSITHLS